MMWRFILNRLSALILGTLIGTMGFGLQAEAAQNTHAHHHVQNHGNRAQNIKSKIPPKDDALLKKLAADAGGITHEELRSAYLQAEKKQSIIDAMNRPGEAKPWYKYRQIFIVPKRINEGRKFLKDNRAIFDRAASTYQVNPEIVAAIIGVETYYGANMGNYRVLDALYTLGFHYPKRAEYFSKEFANYVKLAKQQGWKHNEIKGSYAGAMGMGQFMPWSYMRWAVDFNNDGHKDLFHNKADAIGSVANYFHEHGWIYGAPVTAKVKVERPEKIESLLAGDTKPNTTVGELRKLGVTVPAVYENKVRCRLFKFQTEKGWDYYIGFHNFYVITRYNKSPLYAMAVYDLSQEIIKKPATENSHHKKPDHGKPVSHSHKK